MQSTETEGRVDDPVGHISISGVHGGDELNERIANSESAGDGGAPIPGSVLVGAGLGAALMFLLDPGRGRRRRSLVRDKAVHWAHKTVDTMQTAGRDARNHATGAVAELRSRFQGDEADDSILVERVRSRLGRIVSHPHSVVVTASNGVVTLSGPILADEAEKLVSEVEDTRGVQEVVDQLEPHESARTIPALQGGSNREMRSELRQENWAPAIRLAVGAVGGALALALLRRRDGVGALLGIGGLALLARSGSNKPYKRLVGAGGRRAVDIQKTINIDVPLEQAFDFFSSYESFPQFMSHVREVRDSGNGRSHWIVDGPAGLTVEWDAEITCFERDSCLAWRSVRGSEVESAGIVEFSRNADGTTRVDVKMSYNPPAGVLGHAVAKALGKDPRKQMHDDLARVKTYLETGQPPRDANVQ